MALFPKVDPGGILEEVVEHMKKELHRRGVQVTMDRRTPLPLVRLDLGQFRNALQCVIEFFSTLVPQGGKLEIEAALREFGDGQYVEVGVASPSTPLDVFGTVLQVDNYRAALDIELAYQIQRRYRGKILFQKENPQRMAFTVLLKVP